MKAKEIVLLWIENQFKNRNRVFWSYDFENLISTYGRLAHQKIHTPSTYSRAFRKIREENTLTRFGLELEIIKNNNNKAKGWKIKKMS